MKKLIEALQIFLKYGDIEFPTGCEHDVLYVYVSSEKVSKEDIEALKQLDFFVHETGNFVSYKYGSA